MLSFYCKELIKIGSNVNQTYMFTESILEEDAKHIKNNTSVCFEDPCAKRFFDKKKTEKEMIIKHNFSNPLLAACREGDLNVIKELIKARADIKMQDAVLQKC